MTTRRWTDWRVPWWRATKLEVTADGGKRSYLGIVVLYEERKFTTVEKRQNVGLLEEMTSGFLIRIVGQGFEHDNILRLTSSLLNCTL